MPRPVVWGGPVNLRFAGGTAVSRLASGFLVTEACTQRDVAIRLGKTLAQRSAHPSTDNPGHLSIGSYGLGRESARAIDAGVRPTHAASPACQAWMRSMAAVTSRSRSC